jgi:nicotinate phosphoribosyltransferase
LNEQGHSIDAYGIGTHLVTCQAQPALGGVYKLVQIHGMPRMKLSASLSKVSIPGLKKVYRLYSKEGYPIFDLMTPYSSPAPEVGERILCRSPLDDKLRAYARPSRVEELHSLVWDGKLVSPLPSLHESRRRCITQVAEMREDHRRATNPTPYKVSVSQELYSFMHELWDQESLIREIE